MTVTESPQGYAHLLHVGITTSSLTEEYAGEIADRLAVPENALSVPSDEVDKGVEADILGDFEVRALEFIKDRVAKLDWAQMQELVAGLLRAMGQEVFPESIQ